MQLAAVRCIPDTRSLVIVPGHKQPTIWTERHRRDFGTQAGRFPLQTSPREIDDRTRVVFVRQHRDGLSVCGREQI